MYIKDGSRTWAYCQVCKTAIDMKKGGKCKCDNVRVTVDKNGVAFTEASESEELMYDIDKQAINMADLNKALIKLFKYECPPSGSCYVSDLDDPGGETNWGISKRAHPNEDIKNMDWKRASEIYKKEYWDKMKLNEIKSQEIADEMMDIGVNMGIEVAVRLAQWAYNLISQNDIHIDGIIGPKTIESLNTANSRAIAKTLNILQGARYIELIMSSPKKEKFWKAWMRRIEFGEV